MKKTLLFIAAIAATMYVNAQGTWSVTGTEASIASSTEITTGITNVTCMHSDFAGVIGKGDSGAPSVTDGALTFSNEAIVQGSSNGMYYAFKSSQNGILSIAAKMGAGKSTYVIEVPTTTSTNLADLTTNSATCTDLTGTNPEVTTTAIQNGAPVAVATQAWSGTAMNPSGGANMYVIMKFKVTANTIYAVGVTGSKFMLRGAAFTSTTNISNVKAPEMKVYPNPASGKVFINVDQPSEIGIYSLTGSLVKQQFVTSSNNSINISELNSGIYFVKMMNSNNMTQKLIIQ